MGSGPIFFGWPADARGLSEEVTEVPAGFERLFTGDGGPPHLPDEPDRDPGKPSRGLHGTLFFLLGLSCGLLSAYLIYHVGGRW